MYLCMLSHSLHFHQWDNCEATYIAASLLQQTFCSLLLLIQHTCFCLWVFFVLFVFFFMWYHDTSFVCMGFGELLVYSGILLCCDMVSKRRHTCYNVLISQLKYFYSHHHEQRVTGLRKMVLQIINTLPGALPKKLLTFYARFGVIPRRGCPKRKRWFLF